MTLAQVLLPFQGLVFTAWAGTLFLTLFQLRSLGSGPRYGGQPGIGATLSSFRIFMTQPEWRARRWLLLLLTLVMIGLNVLFYLNLREQPSDVLSLPPV